MTELAVLVPVLNRPQNVKPLVESFLEGCPAGSRLLFLVTIDRDHDEYSECLQVMEQAARAADADMGIIDARWPVNLRVVDAVTWPEKINLGAAECIALGYEWLLFAADDITITPGWWEATKELRDDPSIGVIGTNDSHSGTGNPRVAAGEHTCHPLVRASYIRDLGTSDEPGKAVHDGYHHWCVDDELVWTAKLRNAWAFCRDAVIEHHHPYWKPGTVQWDATYAAGEANAKADMELWAYRAKHVLGLTVQ